MLNLPLHHINTINKLKYARDRMIRSIQSILRVGVHHATKRNLFKLAKKHFLLQIQSLSERLQARRREQAQRLQFTILQETTGPLADGISLIIPTYKGEERIDACLKSIADQTLARSQFEVVFVINGERDDTDTKIKSAFADTPDLIYSILYSELANLPAARNIGIRAAQKAYCCFLDDDDFISENYLEELLAYSDAFTIVLSQVCDIQPDGFRDFDHEVNREIMRASQLPSKKIAQLSSSIAMAGGKLLSTTLMKSRSFLENLRSGEDTVFFTQLLTEWDFTFKVIPTEKFAVYYRSLRNNSVSRQQLSYDFNVEQRLAVLKHLDLLACQTKERFRLDFIKIRISAQAGFIASYLKENPESRTKVVNRIIEERLYHFPFEKLHHNEAKDLVISYCFPPHLATSGIVVAKKIQSWGRPVDIICNTLGSAEPIDPDLNALANQFTDKKFELATHPTFQQWNYIEQFIQQGLRIIQRQVSIKGPYERVYSRSMYPASHFLAYACKLKYPEIQWTAEFSDPLLYDIHNKERFSPIKNTPSFKSIYDEVSRRNLPGIDNKNLFFWCEYLPFLFAEHVIFTNENQRTYILNSFPIQSIVPDVMKRTSIEHQSTLPPIFYQYYKTTYSFDKSLINIAYFGSFYETRGLFDLIQAIRELPTDKKKLLKVHVFSKDYKSVHRQIRCAETQACFRLNQPIGYFQFLNLATQMDCLVLDDAVTKPSHTINPYLPSKLADYRGSDTPIWGVCEPGSELDRTELSFKSPLGDRVAAKKTLITIIDQLSLPKIEAKETSINSYRETSLV